MQAWLARLRAGFGRSSRGAGAGAGHTDRWVVLDVETTGLDPVGDRVLSIGAVAVHVGAPPDTAARIALADSLELRVAQGRAGSRENILVHGIGEQAQQEGLAPSQALQRLNGFAGGSTLLAFHAAFDRAFLKAEARRCGAASLPGDWVDVAELARVAQPDVRARALDEWLAHFGIPVDARHDACADALVTAMLFIRLLAALPTGARGPDAVKRACAGARWLPRA